MKMDLDAIVKEAVEEAVNACAGDIVHVIRCKDCAYYTHSPLGHVSLGWCKLDIKHRNPNFYCAMADSKEKKHD